MANLQSFLANFKSLNLPQKSLPQDSQVGTHFNLIHNEVHTRGKGGKYLPWSGDINQCLVWV